MRTIVRIIVYVGLVGVGGWYRYQYPNRYNLLLSQQPTETTSIVSGSVISDNTLPVDESINDNENQTQTGGSMVNVATGDSIIDLISQQLSGVSSTSQQNPFGEVFVKVPNPNDSVNSGNNSITTNTMYTGIIYTGREETSKVENPFGQEYQTATTINPNNNKPNNPNPIVGTINTSISNNSGATNIQDPVLTTNQPVKSQVNNTQVDQNISNDESRCTAPWGRKIVGGDRTLAFKSSQAINNVCVIEKRICTQGVLGGSYAQHTCYFDTPGGYYEYLGLTGSDSSKLIRDAEIIVGITIGTTSISTNTLTTGSVSTNLSQTTSKSGNSDYQDDTLGISNFSLIDREYVPVGRLSNGGRIDDNTSGGLSAEEEAIKAKAYNLGPIIARVPETKISGAQESRINPNMNGRQGVVNNLANSPVLSYSSTIPVLEATGPEIQPRSCQSPRGTQLGDNQHVIAFESTTVPASGFCKYEYRTCSNGFLRGSYTRQTCIIEGVNNTDTNNPYQPSPGFDLGGNNNRYYSDGNYNNQRYDDRYYEQNNRSYKSPLKYNNNCIADYYGSVGHGSTLTMYDSPNVGSNQSCNSMVRLCQDGRLSGSDQYRYGTCK